jgi:hypothetical protein
MHVLKQNQLQTHVYRNMIRYAQYAAELITSQSFLQCKSSYIPGWSKNCKMWVHQANIGYVFVVLHIFAFVAFATSIIQNPANPTP